MGEAILSIIKLLLAVAFSPILWVMVTNALEYLKTYSKEDQGAVFLGTVVFLLIFLFFNRLHIIYDIGQKIIGNIFKFLAPLDRFITNLFPFYFFVILLASFIFSKFLKLGQFNSQFMFLLSFFFTMHFLNLAVELQEQEQGLVKPNYLLVLCLTMILEILLVVLLFDFVFARSAFNDFIGSVFNDSQNLYYELFKRLTALK